MSGKMWLAVAAAAVIPASTSAISLTEDFETPGNFLGPSYLQYVSGNIIPGWTVIDDGDGQRAYLMDETRHASIGLTFFDKQALMLNEGSGIQRDVSLIAGETYQFSLWGYSNGKGTQGIEVRIGGQLETLFFGHYEFGLTERSFTFTAKETGLTTLQVLNPNDPTGDYKSRGIDNLSLVSVPDGGASLILLGLGLGSLELLRRKLGSK